MQKSKELKIVQFEGRLESYFPDGSLMLKSKSGLTYHTTKGNKVKVSSQTLKLSQEIGQKMQLLADKLNVLEDAYYTVTPIDQDTQSADNSKSIFKKYKIAEFQWEASIVKEGEEGWEIRSDDGNAKVTLRKDLYRATATYLQKTGGRKVTEDGILLNRKNRRKELIEKYGGTYVEYPEDLVNIEIEHQYISTTKQFTILTLPPRWCPPLRMIWGYLLSNQLIPHPFCYIDFEDPDNRVLRDIDRTKMPPLRSILEKEDEMCFQQESIPLYGKPNHSYKWKWLYAQSQNSSIIAYYIEGGGCVLCEQQGFWFIEGSSVFFKTVNKDSHDYKVPLTAFPLTVRFQNQPERDIRAHVLAASTYQKHREYLNSKPEQRENPINSQTDGLICQEELPGIGVFKAYANRVVVARFEDRTLMTIRQEEIMIIAPNGRSLGATLSGTPPKQFKEHLSWLLDWYHRVYYRQEWQEKQAMSSEVQSHIRSTETFLQVASHFQRKI